MGKRKARKKTGTTKAKSSTSSKRASSSKRTASRSGSAKSTKSASRRPATKSSSSKRSTSAKPKGKAPAVKGKTAGRAQTAQKKGAAAGRRSTASKNGSRSEKWIESADQGADRPGQTLKTKNHEVIQKWADERGASPATVGGTEHEGHAGVLRFDFPGYGGQQLQHISWEEWFEPFDSRDLTFIYQEKKADGKQSNFFRLDNPSREDA